jgi:hypothetical protein
MRTPITSVPVVEPCQGLHAHSLQELFQAIHVLMAEHFQVLPAFCLMGSASHHLRLQLCRIVLAVQIHHLKRVHQAAQGRLQQQELEPPQKPTPLQLPILALEHQAILPLQPPVKPQLELPQKPTPLQRRILQVEPLPIPLRKLPHKLLLERLHKLPRKLLHKPLPPPLSTHPS